MIRQNRKFEHQAEDSKPVVSRGRAGDFNRNRAPVRRPVPARPSTVSPVSKEDMVRFVALGGLEEVGRNMMALEYKDEIIVVDMGLQFPEEDTPGIDYIIPNTTYLEERKHKVKAVVITHAHLDHIGAVPYLMGKVGNPPVYTAALTKEMILRRQEEFTNAPKLDIRVVQNHDKVRLSEHFEAEFFGVTHAIPDTLGMILKTPIGNIVHFAEMKFDYDKDGKPQGLDEYERIGKMGVHTLFLDSTGAVKPGFSLSERIVEKNIEEIFKKADGRVIVGAFSTLLVRISEIIKIAEKYDRKIGSFRPAPKGSRTRA
ncbi:MAG: ribonuclease J [Candidatus Wolfebacteria bacterium]|nr:ribonuclease J [Candidatus Wolfebacteria bacterium]